MKTIGCIISAVILLGIAGYAFIIWLSTQTS